LGNLRGASALGIGRTDVLGGHRRNR